MLIKLKQYFCNHEYGCVEQKTVEEIIHMVESDLQDKYFYLKEKTNFSFLSVKRLYWVDNWTAFNKGDIFKKKICIKCCKVEDDIQSLYVHAGLKLLKKYDELKEQERRDILANILKDKRHL